MGCLLPQKQVLHPAVELQAHAAETCLGSSLASCHWLTAEPSERPLECLEPSSNLLDYRKFRLKGLKTLDAPGTAPRGSLTPSLRSPSLGVNLERIGGLVSPFAARPGPKSSIEAGSNVQTIISPQPPLSWSLKQLILYRDTPCLISAVNVSLHATWGQKADLQCCNARLCQMARKAREPSTPSPPEDLHPVHQPGR